MYIYICMHSKYIFSHYRYIFSHHKYMFWLYQYISHTIDIFFRTINKFSDSGYISQLGAIFSTYAYYVHTIEYSLGNILTATAFHTQRPRINTRSLVALVHNGNLHDCCTDQ